MRTLSSRSVSVLALVALASIAGADILNPDFDDGLDKWPNKETIVGNDNGNPFAFLLGSDFRPAQLSQVFDCDDPVDPATVCVVSFRYRFTSIQDPAFTVTGQNGGWSDTHSIDPVDLNWHDASFQFNDPSCGMSLKITFDTTRQIQLDTFSDACIVATPEPGTYAALGSGAMFAIRCRRRRKA